MLHPEVLLLPVLMFADYFLTLAGAALRERRYAEHFRQESYELNPVWKESVATRKWFNPRHILLVALVTALLAFVLERGRLPGPAVECLFGMLFVTEGMLIGRHVSNLLVFRRMARSPSDVTGSVTMSHSMTVSVSAYQFLVVALPLGLVALVDPSPAVLGGVLGAISLFLVHGIWGWRHGRALAKAAAVRP